MVRICLATTLLLRVAKEAELEEGAAAFFPKLGRLPGAELSRPAVVDPNTENPTLDVNRSVIDPSILVFQ